MPIKDSLIAATALTHELTVVTRNRVDFAAAGVEIADPFSGREAAGRGYSKAAASRRVMSRSA